MKSFSWALLLVLGSSLAALAASAPPTFYVSPKGNDAWSGTRAAPGWWRSDGPFATVPRAVQAAREWKQKNQGTGAPGIMLRGGLYFLEKPLVLTPEDSGLKLAAYKGEQPVLSGGRRIEGWKEVDISGRRLWVADVPDAKNGKWNFRELWVNGRRATRARYPNQGYLKVAELPDRTPDWFTGHSRFHFTAGDLPDWAGLTNAEVVVMNRWVESHLPIKAMDAKARQLDFGKRSVFQLATGDLYYVEGAFEALDQPGEWCLRDGTLYYCPRPGETLKQLEAIAPKLVQVVRGEGRPDKNEFIRGLVFDGLTFSHAEWYFPSGFESGEGKAEVEPAPKADVGGFAQAAVGVPGAVWGRGLRECVFQNCRFVSLGTYGLDLAMGCASNRVERCEFADLGAGGIKLGETGIRNTPSEQTGGTEIRDCKIHDGGRVFHSAIGIWIGQSPNNRLLHNLIHDFYYTGISIGWTWGYGPALATNNLVAYNHVHHIGRKSDGDGPILSDMGGIYTLGMQPGSRVENNLWHDIAGLQYGGWGIYFDEGSSSIIARSNVVYRTTHGGFHQHYGATNLVSNNIFAFARDHQIQRTRNEPHVSFTFATNIVYYDTGVLLGGDWSNDRYNIDWNIYWDARPNAKPEDMKFAGATLAQWRARGHDENSIIADPLFVAPGQNDFRLKPGSPALKMFFQPIDLSNVGPQNTK